LFIIGIGLLCSVFDLPTSACLRHSRPRPITGMCRGDCVNPSAVGHFKQTSCAFAGGDAEAVVAAAVVAHDPARGGS